MKAGSAEVVTGCEMYLFLKRQSIHETERSRKSKD